MGGEVDARVAWRGGTVGGEGEDCLGDALLLLIIGGLFGWGGSEEGDELLKY